MRWAISNLLYKNKVFINTNFFKNVSNYSTIGMELKEVVKVLEKYAPQRLAADWDNVGLLLEPTNLSVNKLMLTNDLTLNVLDEAISQKVNMVISYHPPLFMSLKRITHNHWKEKLVVECLEKRIALYSPHTAWDCVTGGVNDWLIKYFAGKVEAIQPYDCGLKSYSVDVKDGGLYNLVEMLPDLKWKQYPQSSDLSTTCNDKQAQRICHTMGDSSKVVCNPIVTFPDRAMGSGRSVVLDTPMSIKEVVQNVKKHLKLTHVQLALANDHTEDTKIKRIASCAGSGASVLKGVQADLYLTGEMSHHEILDCTNAVKGRSASVIITNHSNSERGFLGDFMKSYLEGKLDGKVEVIVSETDRDPLQVV